MLDQNTDRMWFVIGAVLIGAAIIFAANALFDGVIMVKINELIDNLLGFAESNVTDIPKAPGSDIGGTGGVINLVKSVPFF